jgi:hypothetical protein
MKVMMARMSERVLKELSAELILRRVRYHAIIENFSANGMKVRTVPSNADISFSPDELINLEFEIPPGEVLSLHCRQVWSSKISSDILIWDIGLEITEASPVYDEFYKSLFMDNMNFL